MVCCSVLSLYIGNRKVCRRLKFNRSALAISMWVPGMHVLGPSHYFIYQPMIFPRDSLLRVSATLLEGTMKIATATKNLPCCRCLLVKFSPTDCRPREKYVTSANKSGS
jgi:hypothetical protein